VNRDFAALQDGPVDLLVVGGGIYGAWTAYDAALRGLRVALVERDDWASGTSSASSKLIHGGLRYLRHMWLRTVQKSLLERRTLTRIAPHQVRPLRFLFPTYRDHPVNRLSITVGLTLYDLLAGRHQPVARHRSLRRQTVAKAYPFLRTDALAGGFFYGDCGTDDARLALEVVDAAQRAGAVVVNHARVVELLRAGGRVVGAAVVDQEGGATVEVQARVTVGATGPWSRALLGNTTRGRLCRFTKGVHLVLPPLPCDDAMLLVAASDNRVFFLIPWYGRTLVGTTDTAYEGDPDRVAVEQTDVDYLLSELRVHVPGLGWDESHVLGRFAGLRTLRNVHGVAPSAVTREWRLESPEPGLLLPVGGKLTSARVDAGRIVAGVLKALGRPAGPLPTDRPLPWVPAGRFDPWQEEMVAAGIAAGLDAETSHWATHRFGARVVGLHALVGERPDLARRVVAAAPFCRGEIVLAARDEMAITLADTLRRRLPATLFGTIDRQIATDAAALMGEVLGWDTARQQRAVADFLATTAAGAGP
jgi:glycerol-3-phosphate dehydrogenase